jgi:hypothetical protein
VLDERQIREVLDYDTAPDLAVAHELAREVLELREAITEHRRARYGESGQGGMFTIDVRLYRAGGWRSC